MGWTGDDGNTARENFKRRTRKDMLKMRWAMEVTLWATAEIARRTAQPMIVGKDEDGNDMTGWPAGCWSAKDAAMIVEDMKMDLINIFDETMKERIPETTTKSWDKLDMALTKMYEAPTREKTFMEYLLEDPPATADNFTFGNMFKQQY